MSNWKEGFVDVNGVTMHYIRTGGDKPPVLLCHGFSDSAECWTNLAKQLEADYDVTMIDARCHGLSSIPTEGKTVGGMEDDLAAFIEAMGLDRPVVAGHSMGARYTQFFAAIYPHLLRGLILEDPPWRAPSEERTRRNRPGRSEMFKKYREQNLEQGIAECEAEHPEWEAGTCEYTFRAHQQLRFEEYSRSTPGKQTWKDTWPDIKCPVLVFTGDPKLGGIMTDEIYNEAKVLLPTVERVHIPGVGHHIRFAAPEPFTAAVKAFLAMIY